MAAVLKLFWGICLLRNGPEAVPTHTWFLAALAAAVLGMGVVLAKVTTPQMPALLALNVVLLSLAVAASMTWFALYVRRQEARFSATFGALLGTGLVINCAYLVAYELTGGTVRNVLFWLCVLWDIVVAGFILHRALACKLWGGVALSLAVSLVAAIVVEAVLGTMLAPARAASLE